MIDTYKGESVGKKLARMAFWSTALGNLRKGPFTGATFTVLASREGGDISTLAGFGVPLAGITAVDRCAEAAMECRVRWPGANVVHGSVEACVTAQTDALFLDFCAPIGAETLTTCRSCITQMTNGALVGLAFLKGRENATTLPIDAPRPNRRERRIFRTLERRAKYQTTVAIMQAMYGLRAINAHDLLADESGTPASRRFAALLAVLPRHMTLQALDYIYYQSDTQLSRGVPMLIGLFRLHVRKRPCGRGRYFRDDEYSTWERTAPNPRGFDGSDADLLRQAVLEIYERDGGPDLAAMLFNLPRSTVIAWKAHATRGTYGGKHVDGGEPRSEL